ncbi:MAG: hypothetical protein GY864_02665 [Desulfobacterales bacterium]|nr:hypothetical protein [Desulfobacterales bacterium]
MIHTAKRKVHKKRTHERYSYRAPSTYSMGNSDTSYKATTYNYSVDGMCIMTESPLKPGSAICIQMVNHTSDTSGCYHAHVKWCRKIKKPGAHYGIGIQYSRLHTMQAFGFNSTKNRELFFKL